MDNIVEIKNLTKTYDGFRLNNISFTIPKGAIMGFVGENGAGKSSTIKSILGLVKADGGDIHIFGKNIKEHEKTIKEDIGVVLSESMFPDNMNMMAIDKVMSNIFKRWNSNIFFAYGHKFQLPKDKRIKNFSRGMRMKLAITCALSHQPKLLVLDEATSGLDPIVREEILDVFLDFIQDEEHSILISSHITSDIEKVSDYVTFIHQGSIVLSETKDDLIEQYGILRATSEIFAALHKDDYIAYRKSSYSTDVLIKDRHKMQQRFRDAVIDKASLEDIMLYTVKGVR